MTMISGSMHHFEVNKYFVVMKTKYLFIIYTATMIIKLHFDRRKVNKKRFEELVFIFEFQIIPLADIVLNSNQF